MQVDGKGERKDDGKLPIDLMPLSWYVNNHNKMNNTLSKVRLRFAEWFFNDGYGVRNVYDLTCGLSDYDDYTAVCQILQKGAKKYSPRNWERGMSWTICYKSGQRHLAEMAKGHKYDSESNQPHHWHVLCNLLFLMEYSSTCPELDDRPFLLASTPEGEYILGEGVLETEVTDGK